MSEKKNPNEMVTGNGIETSQGVVLISCTFTCRVCGCAELFEWPDKSVRSEDLEGVDPLGLVIPVAHNQNWIVQRVVNTHDGNVALFVLCPTCLALFFSATTQPVADGKT